MSAFLRPVQSRTSQSAGFSRRAAWPFHAAVALAIVTIWASLFITFQRQEETALEEGGVALAVRARSAATHVAELLARDNAPRPTLRNEALAVAADRAGLTSRHLLLVLGSGNVGIVGALRPEFLTQESLAVIGTDIAGVTGSRPDGAAHFTGPEGEWLLAWRATDRGGMSVAIGLRRADLLAGLHDGWRSVLLIGGGFTVLALVVMVGLLMASSRLRRIEAHVSGNEARIRDFVTGAVDWIWETDARHRFTGISDGARQFGISPPTKIGRGHEDLVPSDIAASAKFRAFRASLDRHETFKDVAFPLAATGEARRWFALSGVPVFDEHDEFAGYRGTARDVTAEVAARERLAQSERQLREISAYVPGVLIRFELGADGSFGIPFISERSRDIFGVAPDVAMRRAGALYDVVLAEDAQRYSQSIERSAETLEPWVCEYRIIVGDRVRWIRGHAIPERRPDGAIVWNGILTDVTDRKHAEESLQRSESRFRDGIESMSDAFTLFDRDNKLVVWNKRFEGLFPYLVEHLKVGLAFDEMVELTALLGPLGLGEDARRERWIHTRKRHRLSAGETFEMLQTDGRIVELVEWPTEEGGTVSVCRDVTDQRKAADELRRAKDSAEASERAKGAFLATMSHEIRTPMNGVMGMIELLLETTLSDEQRRTATVIRDSSEALLQIINDILDLSKLEAGKMSIESVPFDLRQTVLSSLEIVGTRAREKGLALSAQIEDSVPQTVIGDPGRLRQILLNLVGNAVKFTEKGAVRVDARVSEVNGSDRMIEFRVTDTGIGIPKEALTRLFGDFMQVDSSISRRYGGTGLGLSICRRLVELMDGRIGVESTVGRGSTFIFSMKVAVSAVSGSQAAAARVEDAEQIAQALTQFAAARGRPIRILLAEDNRTNQLVAASMLQKCGATVIPAANGVEAVEAVRNDEFDIVLMDVHMPDMDGIAATEVIRKLPRPKSQVPIVALTANVLQADIDRCYAAGMVDFVSKPFRKAKLFGVVLQHVTAGAQQPAPVAQVAA